MEFDPLKKQAEELKKRLEEEKAGSGATFHISVSDIGMDSGRVSVVKTKPSGEQVVYIVGEGGDPDGKITTGQ